MIYGHSENLNKQSQHERNPRKGWRIGDKFKLHR